MDIKTMFFVIGVYEDYKINVFPTHVSPIIAECSEKGYRRWHYRIDKPYCIKPVEAIGDFESTPEKLFPLVTYHLCMPKKLHFNSQIIATSERELIVEKNKVVIFIKILKSILYNNRNPMYRKRAWRTILNSWL
jgi:hypothetical protein